jgi:hypothetical protein
VDYPHGTRKFRRIGDESVVHSRLRMGFQARPSNTAGDYHLFAYSDKGGGGIRLAAPMRRPASVPFVHVADIRASFAKALDAGTEVMISPQIVFEGVGIAIVCAPGIITVGVSGPSEGLEY